MWFVYQLILFMYQLIFLYKMSLELEMSCVQAFVWEGSPEIKWKLITILREEDRISLSWFSCGVSILFELGFGDGWFLSREENWRSQRKTSDQRREPITNRTHRRTGNEPRTILVKLKSFSIPSDWVLEFAILKDETDTIRVNLYFWGYYKMVTSSGVWLTDLTFTVPLRIPALTELSGAAQIID